MSSIDGLLISKIDLSKVTLVDLAIDEDGPMVVATVLGSKLTPHTIRWESDEWRCSCEYFTMSNDTYAKKVKTDKHINRVKAEVYMRTGVEI